MNKKLDQNGAVAIITVVIFATIISVLITAYLRSAVTSQKQSVDYDFSNRAFYAAESGVQDTIRLIRSDNAYLANKTDCDPVITSSTDFNAANFGLSYNCQLVTVSPAVLSGRVEPNKQSAMIRLEPSTPLVGSQNLVLRWSSQVPPGSSETVMYPKEGDSKLFKPISSWFLDDDGTQPIHPPLEISVFDHPSAGTFSRSQISQRRAYLNPTDADNSDPSVNFTKASNSVPVQQEQLFSNAQCYISNVTPPSAAGMNSYSCKKTVDITGYNFSTSAIYVRISSLYSATDFSLELLDNSTPVQLKNSQALIDITGKAGSNTYRRVQQAVPLSNFQIQSGPNAALVAGQGICKQFQLGTGTDVYNSNPGCNPLTD